MPRAPLTDDEIAAFRARAVDVAMRLFAEQGYHGVTLRTIATELGVSPMTPYRYFSGKDDIVESVRGLAYERMADASAAAVDGVDDPRERLVALGHGLVGFALDQPHAYRHMFELTQPDAPPIGSVLEAGRGWETMRTAVVDAIDGGVVAGDPDTVAHLLWASLHGLIALHLAHKLVIGRTLTDLLDPMLDGLLRGHAAPSLHERNTS